MIRNILIYIVLLCIVFVFNIFYYEWFSWFLLLLTLCIPFVSLIISLPFMISNAMNGIIVFTNDKININDDFYIGIAGRKNPTIFCPQLKIKLKAKNKFANTEQKIRIAYGGSLKKPFYKKMNKLSCHCGVIEADAKYCKIYDLMGIFFIPVRINCNIKCTVMPVSKKPDKLPDCDKITILGYKPKSGGGFSDFYELRQYQNGDSLKNIHWKLSSKYDDLIVREPSVPIYKQFAVKIELTSDCSDNDSILARFAYVCRYINKNGSVCYVYSADSSKISAISNDCELSEYIKALYQNVAYKAVNVNTSEIMIYSVSAQGEEVSET